MTISDKANQVLVDVLFDGVSQAVGLKGFCMIFLGGRDGFWFLFIIFFAWSSEVSGAREQVDGLPSGSHAVSCSCVFIEAGRRIPSGLVICSSPLLLDCFVLVFYLSWTCVLARGMLDFTVARGSPVMGLG